MRGWFGAVAVFLAACGGGSEGDDTGGGDQLGECAISGPAAGTYSSTSWASVEAEATYNSDGTLLIVLRSFEDAGCDTQTFGEEGSLELDDLPAEVGEHQITGVFFESMIADNVDPTWVRIDEITDTEVKGAFCMTSDFMELDLSGTFTATLCPSTSSM